MVWLSSAAGLNLLARNTYYRAGCVFEPGALPVCCGLLNGRSASGRLGRGRVIVEGVERGDACVCRGRALSGIDDDLERPVDDRADDRVSELAGQCGHGVSLKPVLIRVSRVDGVGAGRAPAGDL